MKNKLSGAILFISIVVASAASVFVKESERGFSFFGPTNATSGLYEEFYRETCPRAESIVRTTMIKLYVRDQKVAPALLRLVFHDCFIQGCDGSVLLNSTNGFMSEKEAKPNLSLKGFDVIDTIKHQLEEECPATVSCSDILVLAARDAVSLIGGPYYMLKTGRRDTLIPNFSEAAQEIPAPDQDLSQFGPLFQDRGFNSQETVVLLGGHNIGTIHCQFLSKRLTNFNNTGKPDPSMEPEFLQNVMSKCKKPGNGINMGVVEGMVPEFGTHYFKSLIEGRGILHADEELMASKETAYWVNIYSSNWRKFQEDFKNAMVKLSSTRVLTSPKGQVRRTCSAAN